MPRSIIGKITPRLATVAGLGASFALVACGGLIPDVFPDGRYPGQRPPATADSFDMRQCTSALASRGVDYRRLPDDYKGGQCKVVNSVQLLDFGVPVHGIGPMTCKLANGFTTWVMSDVETAARRHFGSNLSSIDSFGTYACRNIAGSGNISEHASANAVDISGFRFANGMRISVVSGWNGDNRTRNFLRDVADSACRRFGTVLTPDYNAAHRDHIHLDMADRRSGYCR